MDKVKGARPGALPFAISVCSFLKPPYMELLDATDSKSTSSFPVTSALSPGTQELLTIQYVICALCPSTMSLRFPGCDFWRGIGNANAGVLELVDEVDSKSIASDGVRVRVPPPAPCPQFSLFSRNCGFFFVPPLSLHRSILRVFFLFCGILGGTLEGHFLDRSGIDTPKSHLQTQL